MENEIENYNRDGLVVDWIWKDMDFKYFNDIKFVGLCRYIWGYVLDFIWIFGEWVYV